MKKGKMTDKAFLSELEKRIYQGITQTPEQKNEIREMGRGLHDLVNAHINRPLIGGRRRYL